MASFDEYWKALSQELAKFAESSWGNYSEAAKADAQAFIANTKTDLEDWTKQLASGALTRDDFKWLVAGKKDLADLVRLKQKGLAKVALDSFVDGAVNIIVSTALKTFV